MNYLNIIENPNLHTKDNLLNIKNMNLSDQNCNQLDHTYIAENLSSEIQHYPLIILETVDSTNQYALIQADTALTCLAEYQTQGRGRQGRQWISPYASGLCLSIKQRYSDLIYPLSGLNIALAVTVARTLQQFGIPEIQIKWPNDIQWRNRKLAGLLLESRCLTYQCYDVVIGIGINVKMPLQSKVAIDQLWVDLYTITGKTLSRNQLAVQLINQCWHTLLTYPQSGLTNFLPIWQTFDVLYGRQITLHTPKESVVGVAQGINMEGALILQLNDQKRYFNDGSVAL